MHFKKIFKLFGKVVKNEVVPPFPILVMFFLIKSLPLELLLNCIFSIGQSGAE